MASEIDSKIAELRAKLRDAHANADALSIEDQIRVHALAEQLWHTLADYCLEKATKGKLKASDKLAFLSQAQKCTDAALEYAHHRRQAQKLAKVDKLRAVERRLDHQDQAAARFGEIVDERERRAKLTTVRLEQAKRGKPTRIRGESADRGTGSEG